MTGGVCLSVCLSRRVSRPTCNSRTERPIETQYLEVKRSKFNVTRPINAVTDMAPYATKRYETYKMDEGIPLKK